MVGPPYPSPSGFFQTIRGPALGQLVSSPFSADLLSRVGPRKCSQSEPVVRDHELAGWASPDAGSAEEIQRRVTKEAKKMHPSSPIKRTFGMGKRPLANRSQGRLGAFSCADSGVN